MSIRWTAWSSALLAAAITALAPGIARAATLKFTDYGQQRSYLEFMAADGEANRLSIGVEDGYYLVSDAGAVISASSPCEGVSPNQVRCPLRLNVGMTVELGDGDDTGSVVVPPSPESNSSVALTGGDGGDQLTVAADDGLVWGGGGNDHVAGPRGRLELRGDDGDDRLTGGVNERAGVGGILGQQLRGGEGNDVLIGHDAGPAEFPYDGPLCYGGSGTVQDDDMLGGPGDDVLDGRGGYDILVGQEGNDRLDGGGGCDRVFGDLAPSVSLQSVDWGAPGDDVLDGGAGADELWGGPGADRLDGGGDNDTAIDGGPGADVLAGGGGTDTMSYANRTEPITATLNAVADDGEAGEGDLIASGFERVNGGAGNDVIVGDSAPNGLFGNDGDDTITGGGGVHDVVNGGAGNDFVNTLDGDPEASTTDSFGLGGIPWDDYVSCDYKDDSSTPSDVAVVDRLDLSAGAAYGCTNVVYSLAAIELSRGVTEVAIKVPCPASARACRGEVSLRAPTSVSSGRRFPPTAAREAAQVLGTSTFRARPGKSARVAVRISRRGRKQLKRSGGLRALRSLRYDRPRGAPAG